MSWLRQISRSEKIVSGAAPPHFQIVFAGVSRRNAFGLIQEYCTKIFLPPVLISSFAVKGPVDFPQFFIGEVSVNLGGVDVAVAQKLLHGAQIGAVDEEIGGERMAEAVRVDAPADARLASVEVHQPLNGARGDSSDRFGRLPDFPITFGQADKQRLFGVAAFAEIFFLSSVWPNRKERPPAVCRPCRGRRFRPAPDPDSD